MYMADIANSNAVYFAVIIVPIHEIYFSTYHTCNYGPQKLIYNDCKHSVALDVLISSDIFIPLTLNGTSKFPCHD